MSSDSKLAREVARLRREVEQIKRGQRVAHGASIENAAIEVRDDNGSLRAVVGQQPDGTTGVNVVNGPVPPTPSAPTVESALAALAVTWDGTFTAAPAAPLDWMRCEVHIGPDPDFTPDQGTLRDTIESPQGGTVVVPLPYTEWHVKLRSRTTSGVASPPTAAVAGTPRKADAPDIQAGAIVADHIAVDALDGKTITGSTVQTGTSGQRVVLDPESPDPSQTATATDTVPAVEVHSGAAAQVTPGLLVADVDGTPQAYPYLSLHSPSLKRDPSRGFPITARLQLLGPQIGVRGGAVTLEGNTALGGDDQGIGNVRLYGFTANQTTGESHLELACLSGVSAPGGNGTSLRPRSYVLMDGAQVELRAVSTAGDASLYVRPTGIEATRPVTTQQDLSVGGILTARNIAFGAVSITPIANQPVSASVSGLGLKGTNFRAFVTANTSVPGTQMLGTGATAVSGNGLTVWLTRSNTTTTTVWWFLIGD